jgi:hypothetical protein
MGGARWGDDRETAWVLALTVLVLVLLAAGDLAQF